ncbi:MAG: helix-turn-helix domain-containing protein [Rhodobiaceae bacterium]|nr:helix-turn-helix domain-containing protein [Rhodobiaceae bacterium]
MTSKKPRKIHLDAVKAYPLRLAEIRAKSNLSQVEMAEHLEFDVQVYRRIETKARALTLDEAIYIAHKLQISVADLLEDGKLLNLREPKNTIDEALVDLVRQIPQPLAAPVLGILQALVDKD